MEYKEAISKLSNELGVSEEDIDIAYKSFYKFIRETIKNLPLKDNLSEEEFSKLRTNFNLPSLGKLNCTYEHYLGLKKRVEYLNKIKEEYECKKD